jgi:hypothetical protein
MLQQMIFGIVSNHQKFKKHDEAMKNVSLIFWVKRLK